jgi:hypothetical protein
MMMGFDLVEECTSAIYPQMNSTRCSKNVRKFHFESSAVAPKE